MSQLASILHLTKDERRSWFDRRRESIQKHVKKCFEGIQTMIFVPVGAQGNKTALAVGMNAPDGETAPFVGPVKLTFVLTAGRELR